jgi:hypothetical protein
MPSASAKPSAVRETIFIRPVSPVQVPGNRREKPNMPPQHVAPVTVGVKP